MSDLEDKRVRIYPENSDKMIRLMNALNSPSASHLVNYLIEIVEIEQIVKITMTDAKTKKSYVKIGRNNNYDPKNY